MDLRHVRLTDPVVVPLLEGLAAEFQRRYGPTDVMADAHATEFDPPAGTFVVLVVGGQTVAGGGLRRVDDHTCELKRMWTSSEHRRQGHATAVLGALEDAARAKGYTRILLETGPAQPEAISFYRHHGYRTTLRYGRYDEAVAFERQVAAGDR